MGKTRRTVLERSSRGFTHKPSDYNRTPVSFCGTIECHDYGARVVTGQLSLGDPYPGLLTVKISRGLLGLPTLGVNHPIR